jgi:acyl-CoA thioester hydrolase
MATFKFSYPVEVRYADIDAQGHLNNAKFITFMEHARYKYIEQVGLWHLADGFDNLGQIVARVTCDYKRPVVLGQVVEVAVRMMRLGTKSLEMEFRFTVDGAEVALGHSVQVAYDFKTEQSIPIPTRWRELIHRFEGLPA